MTPLQTDTDAATPTPTPHAALATARAEVARLRELPGLYRAAVERADGVAMVRLRQDAGDLDDHRAAARIVLARCLVDLAARDVAPASAAEETALRQAAVTRAEGLRRMTDTTLSPTERAAAQRSIPQAVAAARSATQAKGQALQRHEEAQQALHDLIAVTAQRLVLPSSSDDAPVR